RIEERLRKDEKNIANNFSIARSFTISTVYQTIWPLSSDLLEDYRSFVNGRTKVYALALFPEFRNPNLNPANEELLIPYVKQALKDPQIGETGNKSIELSSIRQTLNNQEDRTINALMVYRASFLPRPANSAKIEFTFRVDGIQKDIAISNLDAIGDPIPIN